MTTEKPSKERQDYVLALKVIYWRDLYGNPPMKLDRFDEMLYWRRIYGEPPVGAIPEGDDLKRDMLAWMKGE